MRPMGRGALWGEVCLVCLGYLVCLVGRTGNLSEEPKKRNPLNKPKNDLLTLADGFSILRKKTARSCVEHRNCHPNRVTFSNPSVAPRLNLLLARILRPCLVAPTSIARSLNHHPATEAGAAPFARWLHKSGSNWNQAADLS